MKVKVVYISATRARDSGSALSVSDELLLKRTVQACGGIDADIYADVILPRVLSHPVTKADMTLAAPEFFDRIKRIYGDSVYVLLGSMPAYAFGLKGAITEHRGRAYSNADTGGVVLSTYTPGYVIGKPEAFPEFAHDVKKALDIAGGTRGIDRLPNVCVHVLDSYEAVMQNAQGLCDIDGGVAAVDIETTGLDYFRDDILSIGIGVNERDVYIFGRTAIQDVRCHVFLEALFERTDITWVYQNGKFDVKFLRAERPDKLCTISTARCDYDTMLAHYCVDERRGTHGLKVWAREYLDAPDWDAPLKSYTDWASIPPAVLYKYQAYDVYYTRKGYFLFCKMLAEEGTGGCYKRVYQKIVDVFADIEMQGVRIDTQLIEQADRDSLPKIEAARHELVTMANELGFNGRKYAEYKNKERLEAWKEANAAKPEAQRAKLPGGTTVPTEFNPDSSSQLAYVAYELCGVRPIDGVKTCSKEAIEVYRHTVPFWAKLYEYREVAGIYGTFIKGLRERIAPDGNLHPDFMLHGTQSGRCSCLAPNLQNLPRSGVVKQFFMADEGDVIVNADYKTLEVAVAAILSGDSNMQAPFREDRDFHTATTERIFAQRLAALQAFMSVHDNAGLMQILDDALNVSIRDEGIILLRNGMYEQLQGLLFKNYRRASKAVTFGVMYGRGAKSLAENELSCSVVSAEGYVRDFFKAYPGYKKFLERNELSAFTNGYVQNYFGFKRHFPFVTAATKHKIRNQAWNTPVQGTAAQLCLMAVCRLHERLKSEDLGRILFTVHDSIVFSIHKENLETGIQAIVEEMTRNVLNSDVTLKVDIEVGSTYGAVRPIDKI